MAEPKNAPAPQSQLASAITGRGQQVVDFRQLGKTGLNVSPGLYGGFVLEERIRRLQGQVGMLTYKEMDLDSTIGTSLQLIERAGRQAPRVVTPASDHPDDKEAAQFLESCFDDMEVSFSDLLADMLRGIVQYGFYLGCTNFKRRTGAATEGHLRSNLRDGRIGWRSIIGLGQETISRWLMDEDGGSNFVAVEQNAPPLFRFEQIPYDRLVHIRQSTHKNNPLGTSALRCVFKDWYVKCQIETFMAIGAERSVAGLPVMRVPDQVLAGLTEIDRALAQRCQNIVSGIRNNQDGGVLLSSATDEKGVPLYSLDLVSTNSNQIGELIKIITLYDYRIAAALSTEFIKLGESNGATGSYAMHADKTDQYAQMLNNLLKCVADHFNRFAIPRLFEQNDFHLDKLPVLSFGELGNTNLKDLGAFLQSCAAAGFMLAPNQDAEDRIMELAGLPPLPRQDADAAVMPPLGDTRPTDVLEVHEGDTHPAEGEKDMLSQLPQGGLGTQGVTR